MVFSEKQLFILKKSDENLTWYKTFVKIWNIALNALKALYQRELFT